MLPIDSRLREKEVTRIKLEAAPPHATGHSSIITEALDRHTQVKNVRAASRRSWTSTGSVQLSGSVLGLVEHPDLHRSESEASSPERLIISGCALGLLEPKKCTFPGSLVDNTAVSDLPPLMRDVLTYSAATIRNRNWQKDATDAQKEKAKAAAACPAGTSQLQRGPHVGEQGPDGSLPLGVNNHRAGL